MPKNPSLAPSFSPAPITITEAWLTFRLDCQSRRIRPRTIQWYDWTLLPFLEWVQACHSATNLSEITSLHIRSYLVEKQTINAGEDNERAASLHHTHNIARCIRAFFNFCLTEGWLADSPMKTVRMPKKPKKILEAYTIDELKKLLAAAKSDREKSMICFLLDTGVRAGELTALRARDIDLAKRSAKIIEGKGGKDRTVYFGIKTARYLIRHMRGMEEWRHVWWSQLTGQQLGYRGLSKALQAIGDRVKIRCVAHKFRRTFAINSLRKGMNIYVLANVMGHEDIATLRHYLEIVEADFEAGQQQYGIADNL